MDCGLREARTCGFAADDNVPWHVAADRVGVVMDAGLLEAVMGPIWAVLSAVGRKAVSSAEDQAADETVRLGQRLLARLHHRGESEEPARPRLEAAVADAAADPQDADFHAALRGQVRKALTGKDGVDDATLVADLESLLEAAGVRVSANGARSVAVEHNEGIISTGDGARNTIRRGRP